MLKVSVCIPWAPRAVWRVVTWFAWVHCALWGFTWTRRRTCWGFAPVMSGSVMSAANWIWLFVQPSGCAGLAWACRDEAGELPICATTDGTFGGEPNAGGVYASAVVG